MPFRPPTKEQTEALAARRKHNQAVGELVVEICNGTYFTSYTQLEKEMEATNGTVSQKMSKGGAMSQRHICPFLRAVSNSAREPAVQDEDIRALLTLVVPEFATPKGAVRLNKLIDENRKTTDPKARWPQSCIMVEILNALEEPKRVGRLLRGIIDEHSDLAEEKRIDTYALAKALNVDTNVITAWTKSDSVMLTPVQLKALNDIVQKSEVFVESAAAISELIEHCTTDHQNAAALSTETGQYEPLRITGITFRLGRTSNRDQIKGLVTRLHAGEFKEAAIVSNGRGEFIITLPVPEGSLEATAVTKLIDIINGREPSTRSAYQGYAVENATLPTYGGIKAENTPQNPRGKPPHPLPKFGA